MSGYRIIMTAAAALLASLISGGLAAEQAFPGQTLNILYPKDLSAVGRRVNVVVDPATDWSMLPFVQVVAGNVHYPVVETASGRHAVQGIRLRPGKNVITVRGLSARPETTADRNKGKGEKSDPSIVASRSITVFNREGYFGSIPDGYEPHFYHDREQESECSGCHRLDVERKDIDHVKPKEVLCFACHRDISRSRNIHGPAAVWNCLACHDHELSPVKYQFSETNPWTVSKTTQPVEPALFSIAADELFQTASARLVSDDVRPLPKASSKGMTKAKLQELKEARDKEIRKRKERERELFRGVLEYLKRNPSDKLFVEAHVDVSVMNDAKKTDKKMEKKNELARKKLTAARAKAVEMLLKTYGVTGKNRMRAAGMGSSLPKSAAASNESKMINNRIEIVAHPPDVQVRNSMKLPLLRDRERVVVNISYGRARGVKNLKYLEKLPRGVVYVKGTAIIHGAVKEPQTKDGELQWQLGDIGPNFQEAVSFVVKKEGEGTSFVNPPVRLAYWMGKKEEIRNFDPLKPEKPGLSVQETCEKCHGATVSGVYRHGPVEAGYCNLCHDPHGSPHPAWTRKSAWNLCTTCHAEKTTEVHVLAGNSNARGHPTRRRMDPSRPGKQLSCISCHAPHGADTKSLLQFGVRHQMELCGVCHGKSR